MATSGVSDIEDFSSSSHLRLDIKSLILYNLRNREGSWRYPYGYHRVFFGGCIIIGPVRSWWWLLELFCLILTITFIVEYNWHHLGVWITGLVLYLVVFASSWKTLMTDPGIIKKPPFPEALENAAEAADRLPPFGSFRSAYMYIVSKEGVEARHTYCFRCHVWIPPEAGHCRICGCCQLDWDHHCPIFGGCVAKKNLASFYIMVGSIPVFVLYLLVVSVVSGILRYNDGRATSIYSASFVADEILIGIVLAFILPPLLALLPCEKEKDQPRDPPPDNRVKNGTLKEMLFASRYGSMESGSTT